MTDNPLLIAITIISAVAGTVVVLLTLIRWHYDGKLHTTLNKAPVILELNKSVAALKEESKHYASIDKVTAMQIKVSNVEKDIQSIQLGMNDLKHGMSSLNNSYIRSERELKEFKTEVNSKLDRLLDMTVKSR